MQLLADAANHAVGDLSASIEKNMGMSFTGIDLVSGDFLFANAGHCDILHGSTESVKSILEPGSTLGMNKELKLGMVKSVLDPGDVLVFYTDGLLENKGSEGRSLKWNQLKSFVSHSLSPSEIQQGILKSCAEKWKGKPIKDDITLLILKWKGKQ